MRSMCINHRGPTVIGLLLNDDLSVTKIGAEESFALYGDLSALTNISMSTIPRAYIALKRRPNLFESPVTNWDLIDNSSRDKTDLIKLTLKDLYVKSTISYISVIVFDINYAAALLKSNENKMCKYLALHKITRLYCCYF